MVTTRAAASTWPTIRQSGNSAQLTVRADLRLADERRLSTKCRINERVEFVRVEKCDDEVARRYTFGQGGAISVAVACTARFASMERFVERPVDQAPIENFTERLYGCVRYASQEIH